MFTTVGVYQGQFCLALFADCVVSSGRVGSVSSSVSFECAVGVQSQGRKGRGRGTEGKSSKGRGKVANSDRLDALLDVLESQPDAGTHAEEEADAMLVQCVEMAADSTAIRKTSASCSFVSRVRRWHRMWHVFLSVRCSLDVVMCCCSVCRSVLRFVLFSAR
jgi:hypothetical protein